MTTELEEQFFKVFGIEKNNNNCPMLDKNNCVFVPSECNYYQYPEITGRKLLEMICILVKTQTSYPINKSNIKDIKYEVLQRCVNLKSYIKHQIKQLFKGGE